MNEHIDHITKHELLDKVRVARVELEDTLALLSEAQMLVPGMEGEWTIKDVLAHLACWESEMTHWLSQALAGEIPDIPQSWEDVHRRNACFYTANLEKPFADVMATFHVSYLEALRAVESIPEIDLVDPGRFPWREGSPLWKAVAANTWWHYAEHNQDILKCLAKKVPHA